MAKKDYAKPKHKLSHKKKRYGTHQRSNASFGASALLVAMVAVLGLIIMVMLALNKWHLIPGRTHAPSPKHHPTPAPAKKKAPPQQTASPQYDFYTVLPQNSDQPTTEKNTPPPSPPEAPHYFLQAASFTTHKEADSLRGQLILEGFNAQVEKAMAKGKPWYRVVAGPYSTKKKADEAMRTLKQNHHLNSLLVEKKP